jgi:large subunit ribosomal protein L10
LAFSKKHKGEMQEQYNTWLKKSQALIMVEYSGLDMKGINAIRAKARDAGGEFHVVKNTLLSNVFKAQNITIDEKLLSGSTAVGFAFNDAPAMAKAMTDFVKGNEVFKVKGGYLGNQNCRTRSWVGICSQSVF